jgi:orotate phosphoribosyltransferase
VRRRTRGTIVQFNYFRVVLIEDLVSFGGSALAAVEALEAEGGKVIGVQAILTRKADGAKGTAEFRNTKGLEAGSASDYPATKVGNLTALASKVAVARHPSLRW